MDRRGIWVVGNDNVARPVDVTRDESYRDWWRISRANARRVAGQPLRCGYEQKVTISGQTYWIVRQRCHTAKWARIETLYFRYFLMPNTTVAECLKD